MANSSLLQKVELHSRSLEVCAVDLLLDLPETLHGIFTYQGYLGTTGPAKLQWPRSRQFAQCSGSTANLLWLWTLFELGNKWISAVLPTWCIMPQIQRAPKKYYFLFYTICPFHSDRGYIRCSILSQTSGPLKISPMRQRLWILRESFFPTSWHLGIQNTYHILFNKVQLVSCSVEYQDDQGLCG